jgi:hypothetical protein
MGQVVAGNVDVVVVAMAVVEVSAAEVVVV